MGTSLDFLTDGVVVIADAIKIVQNSKEKINQSTSQKEDDNKESKDYIMMINIQI
jgi:hypothetical protein